MNKIFYFVLLIFIFLFISACKNESQPEKTQKQQTIEKKEPVKEKKTTGIDICKRKETTKLHLAAKNSNNPEKIFTLIKEGADINACDSEGKMPIHWAAWKNKNLSILEALIKAGANVNAQNIYGQPVFDYAFFSKNLETVNFLIKAGADVNFLDKNGTTVLMSNFLNNKNDMNIQYEIAKTLIQSGADVNLGEHTFPLSFVISQNKEIEREKLMQIKIINMLIQAGADVNAKHFSDESHLHRAAGYNTNPEVIEILIQAGADVNAKDRYNKTPLDAAIIASNAKAFFALIKAGATTDDYEKISKEIINKKFNPEIESGE